MGNGVSQANFILQHRNKNENFVKNEIMSKKGLVRTNMVAPIVIRNCYEEFQHIIDIKEPIRYARVLDGMPEHPMVKEKYFLSKSNTTGMDQLGTFKKFKAPNVRYTKNDMPVFGLGQPTLEGLKLLIGNLKDDGYQDIFIINLRAEPVLFVRDGDDNLPCVLRCHTNLNEILLDPSLTSKQVEDLEVQIRKEILDLAGIDNLNRFYIYDDVEGTGILPQHHTLKYEDDLSVSEEIFCRPTFTEPGLRYLRMCMKTNCAPREEELDDFLRLFKDIPCLFDQKNNDLPVLMFICESGIGRANIGMVLGSLLLLNIHGFPAETQRVRHPPDKSINYEKCEFRAITILVQSIVEGSIRKQEVDYAIDICSQLYCIRSDLYKTKQMLDSIEQDYLIEGIYARQLNLLKAKDLLECYFYLLCFNAYLHEQLPVMFHISFGKWMKSRPELYRILSQLNCSERQTHPNVLSTGQRFMVMDDCLYQDLLSTKSDIGVSNFRRLQGLPVFGMAQPCREGLTTVHSTLSSEKYCHPSVVFFNLRDDVVLECDGISYCCRDPSKLTEAITLPGISTSDIETLEDLCKKEVKNKKMYEVYEDLNLPRVTKQVNCALTQLDMFEQHRQKNPDILYYRVPIWDARGLAETDFDRFVYILKNIETIECDEDGPALAFFCSNGRGRTTTAMAIAGLIICHKRGFPYGTKPGEEERVSLPNAAYTKGDFQVVQKLVRKIPNGQQVKREVDFILDQCSETMTPMHYHVREIIFVTYNRYKKAKSDNERAKLKRRSVDYLERYIFLITFNAYLHSERATLWERPFSVWLKEIGVRVGIYEILDDLAFYEFEKNPCDLRLIRNRWKIPDLPI